MSIDAEMKMAIRNGDAEMLRRLLAGDASRANALICWGKNDCIHTHPLHFVSDVLFEGALERGKELALIDALIEAGADLNFQQQREDGRKSDTPLIGAASLGAEEAGLRLLEAGADATLRGMFGETALHWAAFLGEDRLTQRLVMDSGRSFSDASLSDLNLKDERYHSPPLGWAIHGCYNPPAGNHGRQREVAALLVGAGAIVEPEWLESAQVRADAVMLATLNAGRRR